MSEQAPTATIQLVAFEKVLVEPGHGQVVSLRVSPRQLAVLHNASTTHSKFLDDAYAGEADPTPPSWVLEPVSISLFVGGQQPNQAVAAPSNVLAATVHIVGEATPLATCLFRDGALDTLPY